MASNATTTMTLMIDMLPETLQNQVLEHLQEYLVKLADESDELLQDKRAKMLQDEIDSLKSKVGMLRSNIDELQSHIEMYESQIDQLEDLQDEFQWEITFKKTQNKLTAAAQKAKKEIAEGKAEPMDLDRL